MSGGQTCSESPVAQPEAAGRSAPVCRHEEVMQKRARDSAVSLIGPADGQANCIGKEKAA